MSLIRPVGLFVLGVVLIYFIIDLILKNNPFKFVFKNFINILSGWLILIGPWLLRNFIFTGHIFFHTLPGDHFLNLSAAKIYSEVNGVTYFESQNELQNQINLYAQKNNISNEVEICKLKESLAKKYFLSYPLVTIEIWFQDILRTIISLHSSYLIFIEKIKKLNAFTNQESFISRIKFYLMPSNNFLTNFIVWLEMFQYFVLLILFSIFLIKNFIKILLFKIDIKIYFLLGLISMFILISIAGGYARIRVPIEPLIIILSII